MLSYSEKDRKTYVEYDVASRRLIDTVLDSSPTLGAVVINLGQFCLADCKCLSEETLKAVGPFNMVSMPTRFHTGSKCITCLELHILDDNSEMNQW